MNPMARFLARMIPMVLFPAPGMPMSVRFDFMRFPVVLLNFRVHHLFDFYRQIVEGKWFLDVAPAATLQHLFYFLVKPVSSKDHPVSMLDSGAALSRAFSPGNSFQISKDAC